MESSRVQEIKEAAFVDGHYFIFDDLAIQFIMNLEKILVSLLTRDLDLTKLEQKGTGRAALDRIRQLYQDDPERNTGVAAEAEENLAEQVQVHVGEEFSGVEILNWMEISLAYSLVRRLHNKGLIDFSHPTPPVITTYDVVQVAGEYPFFRDYLPPGPLSNFNLKGTQQTLKALEYDFKAVMGDYKLEPNFTRGLQAIIEHMVGLFMDQDPKATLAWSQELPVSVLRKAVLQKVPSIPFLFTP